MSDAHARFEALVQAFAADLYRFACWLARDRQRAEDLVQETFLRAWRALPGLRDERAAKHWLITILRREHARGFERVRPELDPVDPDQLAAEADPAPAETLALRRALAELAPEYREPLLLQVLGGYDCAEIADELGLTRGAVMTRLFRARLKLRAALEAEPPMAQREVKS
jgi:RNA polymerase sigma-70 factor (ECF subfamily)